MLVNVCLFLASKKKIVYISIYFFYFSFIWCVYFLTVCIPGIMVSHYLSLSLIPFLHQYFQRYEVISVPVIQSARQQKTLPAFNRFLSEAKRKDTSWADIILFHYWWSLLPLYVSLNPLIYPHLHCSTFHFIYVFTQSSPLSFFSPRLFKPETAAGSEFSRGLLTLLPPGKVGLYFTLFHRLPYPGSSSQEISLPVGMSHC